MTVNGKPDRGSLRLDAEECKGCGLCVEACPPEVLHLAAHLNRYGYHPVAYAGQGCTGCGICFFACPEPGAITVLRLAAEPKEELTEAAAGGRGASPCRSNSSRATKRS